jgi:hypothetical protein
VGSMPPVEAVKILPGGKCLAQTNIMRIRRQLIELLLICAIRSLHFTIQLRGSRLDIHVSDSPILHIPMEMNLPLISAVRNDGMAAEWKLLNHIINEVN